LIVFFFVVVATSVRGGAAKLLSFSDELLFVGASWHRIRLQVGDLGVDLVVARTWRLLVLLLPKLGALARSKPIARS